MSVRVPTSVLARPAWLGLMLSGPIHKYGHVRGKEFLGQARRERRTYPPAVCKERTTPPAPKRTAARRVAPNLACGFVAPRLQSAGGYAPSSRLATGQIGRNERARTYEMDH